ncbi:MAG: hypothetical protein WED10_00270 [Brumimicrobium sp.]
MENLLKNKYVLVGLVPLVNDFLDKAAQWLSLVKEIKKPYLAALMLKCLDVKKLSMERTNKSSNNK